MFLDNALAKKYSTWSLLSLVIMIITAWFSAGYFHPDEHYQVLEFCNYKMGLSPLKDLPWEYEAQCRTSLQPSLFLLFWKSMKIVGLDNPFLLINIVRVITAIAAWLTIRRLIRTRIADFSTPKQQYLYVLFSFFLWFIPYLGVRYSAENISAMCFFWASTYLLDKENQQKYTANIWAGVLLGFSLMFRLQLAFAMVGVVIWVLFVAKLPIKNWLSILLGSCLAVGITVLVDRWFYGNWVFTPYKYFEVNIIKNVAANYGVQPFWHYIPKFIEIAIPPFSIVLLYLLIMGIKKIPTHLYTLSLLFFVLGHSAIGHKEFRFLFPMLPAMIYLCVIGAPQLIDWYSRIKAVRIIGKILLVGNFGIILFRMFTPSTEVVKYYEYLHRHASKQPATLVSFKHSPYRLDTIECNYYKPHNNNLKIEVLPDTTALQAYMQAHPSEQILYMCRSTNPKADIGTIPYKRVYCLFPEFVLSNNVNNWQDRSYIWTINVLKIH